MLRYFFLYDYFVDVNKNNRKSKRRNNMGYISNYYVFKKRTYDALIQVEKFYEDNDSEEYIVIDLSEYHSNIQFPSLRKNILDFFPELTVLLSSDCSEILIIKNDHTFLKSKSKLKKFFKKNREKVL